MSKPNGAEKALAKFLGSREMKLGRNGQSSQGMSKKMVADLYLLLEVVLHPHPELLEFVPLLRQPDRAAEKKQQLSLRVSGSGD